MKKTRKKSSRKSTATPIQKASKSIIRLARKWESDLARLIGLRAQPVEIPTRIGSLESQIRLLQKRFDKAVVMCMGQMPFSARPQMLEAIDDVRGALKVLERRSQTPTLQELARLEGTTQLGSPWLTAKDRVREAIERLARMSLLLSQEPVQDDIAVRSAGAVRNVQLTSAQQQLFDAITKTPAMAKELAVKLGSGFHEARVRKLVYEINKQIPGAINNRPGAGYFREA